jgi:hypothetical protein
MRRKFAATASAALIAVVGAGAALAGEVKGPPGNPENPGSPTVIKTRGVAASGCAFSGLNDYVQGQMDRITQNYGTNIQLGLTDPAIYGFPGTDCNPTQAG